MKYIFVLYAGVVLHGSSEPQSWQVTVQRTAEDCIAIAQSPGGSYKEHVYELARQVGGTVVGWTCTREEE